MSPAVPLDPLAARPAQAAYSLMVVISHPRHAAQARAACAEGGLVIATDWLVWQELAAEGLDCLPLEAGLADFAPDDESPLRLGDWAAGLPAPFDDLAQTFNRELEIVLLGVERLVHGLDHLCRTYGIRRLRLIDLRSEFGLLDEPLKRLIIAEIARRHGLEIEDRFDPPPAGDSFFPDDLGYGRLPPSRRGGRARLIGLLCAALGRMTGGVVPRGRSRVLLFLNPLMERGLLDHHCGGDTSPVLISQRSSKRPGFVARCLRRGVVLADLSPRAAPPDLARGLAHSLDHLRRSWDADPAAEVIEAARRLYLSRAVFAQGRLALALDEMTAFEAMLGRAQVDRIVVGDASNATARVLGVAARRRGIAIDEMLNGMFLHTGQSIARHPINGKPPSIDRMLTWGRQQEDWLARRGATVPQVRIGYPGLDSLPRLPDDGRLPPAGRGRVLLLPLATAGINRRALRTQVPVGVVAITRMLRDLGHREIRLKLHPGFSARYFQAISDRFDLGLDIVEQGLVPDHLAWADLVIGPVESGAMVEVLAMGRPYLPITPTPHSIDEAVFGPIPLIPDAEALRRVLIAGRAPDRRAILDHVCDGAVPGRASRRFWELPA